MFETGTDTGITAGMEAGALPRGVCGCVCVYVHYQVMDEEIKILDKILKIFNDTPLWSEQGRRERSRNHLPQGEN